MACRRPDDKPLSEPMMVRLPTLLCVTRPQWVKFIFWYEKLCIFIQISPKCLPIFPLTLRRSGDKPLSAQKKEKSGLFTDVCIRSLDHDKLDSIILCSTHVSLLITCVYTCFVVNYTHSRAFGMIFVLHATIYVTYELRVTLSLFHVT